MLGLTGPLKIKVLWDLDSCPIPPTLQPVQVVRSILKFTSSLGTLENVTCFGSKITVPIQKQLQASSVLFSISPTFVSDMVLMLELFKIASDHRPPFHVVLVMGDRPFYQVIEVLTMRGFGVTLLHPATASKQFVLSVTKSVEWDIFLGVKKANYLNILSKPRSAKVSPASPYPITKKTEIQPTTSGITLTEPYSLYEPQQHDFMGFLSPTQPVNIQATHIPVDTQSNFEFHPSKSYSYPNPGNLQIIAKFSPLIETIRLLQRPEKPQVLLSMLGGRCDWKNMGYPKLRDYVLDAYQHGLCMFGGNPPQEWAAITPPYNNVYGDIYEVPSVGVDEYISPYPSSTMDEAQILFSLLPAALQQLKRQFFKPTETAIKGALKSLQRNRFRKITLTPSIWEEVICLAAEANYVISSKPPKRVVYMASDFFEGADPDHPETEFPDDIWEALSSFLREQSPGKKNGRFGFAECLSCKGPVIIRQMPLGKICELVQQALMKKMLEFHKGFVGVAEENGSSTSPPPSANENSETQSCISHSEIDPADENSSTILNLLPRALETLKTDMLKPYEQVVQARIRQLAENTKLSFKKKHWSSVLGTAIRRGYVITDTPLGKLIYGPEGHFHGVDPRHPQSRFEGYVWDALQAFLVSIHPLRYPLRYQFATFLKNEGPIQLQVLPLGIISELVEAAISRGYLRRIDPKTIATTDFVPLYSGEGKISNSQPRLKDDPVSVLNSVCQQFLPSWPLPVFVVVDCTGPPHSPTYLVIAILLDIVIGEGQGASKKEGHSIAALNVLNSSSSPLFNVARSVLTQQSYSDLQLFLQDIGSDVSLPPTETTNLLNISLPTGTCNWFYVASISRNLSDQPSPDNVALAVQMIEEFQTCNHYIPIPGLVNAVVSSVHLHYLREFDVTLIQRLGEVIIPLNNWAIRCNIFDHYPVLPEASLKILFVAGGTQKISNLLLSYVRSGYNVELDWLVNALPHSFPNPAHCVLKLCRSHLHNDQSQEQSKIVLQLLQAYEKIDYKVTNRDRQHASQVLIEWEQRKIYPQQMCEWFANLFQVFSSSQCIQPNSGKLASSVPLYPVTFQWRGKGEFIKLAGSFNEWTEYIPLIFDSPSSQYPQVILELPEGIHQYKFIVDGDWQCDLDAPLLVEPLSGYKNNYVNVKPLPTNR